MSLKQLAIHIAQISGMPAMVVNTDSVNLEDSEVPEINSTEELVELLESGLVKSIAALSDVEEEDLSKTWKMYMGEQLVMEMAKIDFIRKMGINHLYHHRGQLSVYLRELDIPVPGLYGPSADEK